MKSLNIKTVVLILLTLISSFESIAQLNEEMVKIVNDYKNHKISFEEYSNAFMQNVRNEARKNINSRETKNNSSDFDQNQSNFSGSTEGNYYNNENYQSKPKTTQANTAKVYSFDPEATNFDRFENSPCYDEIGFNPTWDLTSLEKRYCDCENEKNLKTAMNVLYILAFAAVIIGVFYFSRKKRT